jgi:hypothetical protein
MAITLAKNHWNFAFSCRHFTNRMAISAVETWVFTALRKRDVERG